MTGMRIAGWKMEMQDERGEWGSLGRWRKFRLPAKLEIWCYSERSRRKHQVWVLYFHGSRSSAPLRVTLW